MNDWIRDLDLPKDKAEILTSHMKERNFATPDDSVTYYRNRHNRFSKYFRKSETLCYCHDIHGLFKKFKEEYKFKANLA